MGVKTLNDLKGKRIAFEAGGPSEFFIYYLLNTVKLNPKQDVKLLPQLTIDSAIAMFNEQKADVVVGWEPTIFDAKKSGQLLVSTKDFRPIVDVIVTSREAVADKRSLVDIFHDVWFDAIETQEKDFTSAATAIASWGHPAFTGINPNSASQDLRSLLTNIAQANRADNARAVYTPSVLIDRLRSMRKIWAAAGYSVPTSDITQIIEARFIDAAAKEDHTDIGLPNKLVNGTFSLGSELIRASTAQPAATSTNAGQAAAPTAADALKGAQTVATLPCARFEFVPNSTALQAQSQQDLQQCAVDVLQQNPGLFVRVKGSSAWPGPKGTYSQQQVEDAARSRAQGVVDFLVAQGIKADRFVVEWTLPPQDHWETDDVLKQAQDRYVEITLLSSGL